MARGKLKRSVQASTILEVVVSMVIIVVAFGIAMMIYTNVTRMSLSAKKIRAQMLLQETMLIAEHTSANVTQTINKDDFRIEKEVKPYHEDAVLTDIHLTAYDQNQQKVAELRKIIINQP